MLLHAGRANCCVTYIYESFDTLQDELKSTYLSVILVWISQLMKSLVARLSRIVFISSEKEPSACLRPSSSTMVTSSGKLRRGGLMSVLDYLKQILVDCWLLVKCESCIWGLWLTIPHTSPHKAESIQRQKVLDLVPESKFHAPFQQFRVALSSFTSWQHRHHCLN